MNTIFLHSQINPYLRFGGQKKTQINQTDTPQPVYKTERHLYEHLQREAVDQLSNSGKVEFANYKKLYKSIQGITSLTIDQVASVLSTFQKKATQNGANLITHLYDPRTSLTESVSLKSSNPKPIQQTTPEYPKVPSQLKIQINPEWIEIYKTDPNTKAKSFSAYTKELVNTAYETYEAEKAQHKTSEETSPEPNQA
jgi:hypothetical protein